jgi:hypothetical protein
MAFFSNIEKTQPSRFRISVRTARFFYGESQSMSRIFVLLLAGCMLAIIPACGGGAPDSRNKDLDRPKSADEKPVEAPRKDGAAVPKDGKIK